MPLNIIEHSLTGRSSKILTQRKKVSVLEVFKLVGDMRCELRASGSGDGSR
jgi:hypothetical protein